LATAHNQVIDQLGASAYLLTLEVILVILISLASGILLVYASIAIGHLFNRHKMLASFGAFIALNTLTQIFFKLVSLIPGIAHFYNFSIHNMAACDSVRYQLVICYVCISTRNSLIARLYFLTVHHHEIWKEQVLKPNAGLINCE